MISLILLSGYSLLLYQVIPQIYVAGQRSLAKTSNYNERVHSGIYFLTIESLADDFLSNSGIVLCARNRSAAKVTLLATNCFTPV